MRYPPFPKLAIVVSVLILFASSGSFGQTAAKQLAAKPRPVMDRAAIEAGLKAHDRALYIKAGWIRDPYIVPAPDGYYYLTGTTPLPGDPRETSDPYNIGLGGQSIVGWKMQAWRSRDLVDWEALGTPYSLKDGIWFQESPEAFAAKPESEWRLWAPELHFLDGKWAIIHTSPVPVAGANLSFTAGPELSGPLPQSDGRRHRPPSRSIAISRTMTAQCGWSGARRKSLRSRPISLATPLRPSRSAHPAPPQRWATKVA